MNLPEADEDAAVRGLLAKVIDQYLTTAAPQRAPLLGAALELLLEGGCGRPRAIRYILRIQREADAFLAKPPPTKPAQAAALNAALARILLPPEGGWRAGYDVETGQFESDAVI